MDVNRRAKEALKKIGEKIYEHRQQLALAFQRRAHDKSTVSLHSFVPLHFPSLLLPLLLSSSSTIHDDSQG